MSEQSPNLAGASPQDAVTRVMDGDISDLMDQAVLVERRPAKMVTALRIDLDVQAKLESAATARGIGTSTLMRQIIEEWVRTNHAAEPGDKIDELVRHLDAARRAADSIARRAA
jgi:hypothetical protein